MARALPEPDADPAPGPAVALSGTEEIAITAAHGGRYRLQIGYPAEPPPSTGFPVIYLVDGDALFLPALGAARLQAGRPEVTGVGPAVLVGIGYPGAALFDHDRRRVDLLPEGGGADRFLDFLEGTVMPLVGRRFPVDAARATLIGHSFGGLFALHALFTRTAPFSAYVAGSPSIWWNERAILAGEARFRAQSGKARQRLLIAVGGAEQENGGLCDPQRAERLAIARMCDNAREMAERLKASGRIACRHVVFGGENHASVVPAMLSRAIAFAQTGEIP